MGYTWFVEILQNNSMLTFPSFHPIFFLLFFLSFFKETMGLFGALMPLKHKNDGYCQGGCFILLFVPPDQ